MAKGSRGGRPFRPIQARTREAAALAGLLRDLVTTSGLTLAELAATLGVAQSTVSDNLSGRVPGEQFVMRLVAATSRDHRDRVRALELLRAAERAAKAPPSPRLPARTGQADLDAPHDRLEGLLQLLRQAENQRDELRGTLDNTTRLVILLLGIMQALQQRVAELTTERDLLLGHREEIQRLHEAQQRLVRANAQERQAVDELVRAETRRTEAERLLSQVLDQMGRLTEQVALLQGREQPLVPAIAEPATGRQPAPAERRTDPVADDIDRALARVTEIGEEEQRTVDRITVQLGASSPSTCRPASARTDSADRPHPMDGGRDATVVTFYSTGGGVGRTTVLANCAWILAANGDRVLAVDWNLDMPDLHRYFGPLLDQAAIAEDPGLRGLLETYRDTDRHGSDGGRAAPSCVSGHVRPVRWEFPNGGGLDVLPAGPQQLGAAEHPAEPVAAEAAELLGADLRHHYDYVLIDSPPGTADGVELCTAVLPDDVVVCFTFGERSIESSTRFARRIVDDERSSVLQVLPLAMRVDEGEKEKVDAGRALARARFAGLPDDVPADEAARYWASMEIPYRPYYAYEPIPAVFGDQPGVPNSLLAACERLTATLTGGQVDRLPPIDDELRFRWLDAFTRRRPSAPPDLRLLYAPEDERWAAWMYRALSRAGLRVLASDTGGPLADGLGHDPLPGALAAPQRTLVVVSPALLRTAWFRPVWEAVRSTAPGLLIPVRVNPGAPVTDPEPTDLFGLDESDATVALLRAIGLDAVDPPDPVAGDPVFPGSRPRYWQVPERDPAFRLRLVRLDDLRARVVEAGTVVLLPAPRHEGGITGRSLALEYAHRFRAEYDLVHWIDASDPDEVTRSLAELARRLGAYGAGPDAEAAEAAREALHRGTPAPRWLLVLDDAADYGTIRHHLPDGPGHTLVLSDDPAWTDRVDRLGPDALPRGGSLDLPLYPPRH